MTNLPKSLLDLPAASAVPYMSIPVFSKQLDTLSRALINAKPFPFDPSSTKLVSAAELVDAALTETLDTETLAAVEFDPDKYAVLLLFYASLLAQKSDIRSVLIATNPPGATAEVQVLRIRAELFVCRWLQSTNRGRQLVADFAALFTAILP